MRPVSLALLLAPLMLLGEISPAAARERSVNNDPNRMVCEKQEVLGTRLSSKRVCKTAAEWAMQRREERNAIDRAQRERNSPQP